MVTQFAPALLFFKKIGSIKKKVIISCNFLEGVKQILVHLWFQYRIIETTKLFSMNTKL